MLLHTYHSKGVDRLVDQYTQEYSSFVKCTTTEQLHREQSGSRLYVCCVHRGSAHATVVESACLGGGPRMFLTCADEH